MSASRRHLDVADTLSGITRVRWMRRRVKRSFKEREQEVPPLMSVCNFFHTAVGSAAQDGLRALKRGPAIGRVRLGVIPLIITIYFSALASLILVGGHHADNHVPLALIAIFAGAIYLYVAMLWVFLHVRVSASGHEFPVPRFRVSGVRPMHVVLLAPALMAWAVPAIFLGSILGVIILSARVCYTITGFLGLYDIEWYFYHRRMAIVNATVAWLCFCGVVGGIVAAGLELAAGKGPYGFVVMSVALLLGASLIARSEPYSYARSVLELADAETITALATSDNDSATAYLDEYEMPSTGYPISLYWLSDRGRVKALALALEDIVDTRRPARHIPGSTIFRQIVIFAIMIKTHLCPLVDTGDLANEDD